MGGAYQDLPSGCPFRQWLLMEGRDGKYGLKGDNIVATLSENVEPLMCNPSIMAVGMP